MKSSISCFLELLPMLLYLIACVGCSAYFIYTFASVYAQMTIEQPVEIGLLSMF